MRKKKWAIFCNYKMGVVREDYCRIGWRRYLSYVSYLEVFWSFHPAGAESSKPPAGVQPRI